MNIRRHVWLGVVTACVALAGCAGTLPTRPGAHGPADAELLSGEALFGEPVSATELPDEDLRGLDDEMREFVATAIAGTMTAEGRLLGLLRAMLGSGLFSLDYDGELTLTARQTFHAQTGNCLAFTNLFVALAREARLEVTYQHVEVPAFWSGDGDLAILNEHVNVLVRDTTGGTIFPRLQVVDFNLPGFRGDYPQWPISDSRVDALFYNNLATTAMRAEDTRTAFVYLRKALEAEAGAALIWSNLGVLYMRNDRPDHAEAAFHRALQADPKHKSAMSNLARLYDQQGLVSLAADYRERIRRHQERNPYYHLGLAEKAYEEGRPDAALAAVDRAIRLRKDEHRFHYMRALILARTGRIDASRASLERAREYSSVAQVQEVYERKLRSLN